MSAVEKSENSSSNRLINEKSPYLLQHARNPVNWYPWGEEAFKRARKEDKPVFLSIGYATCHWCHVMAHESFEDAEVARILNKYFVAIKVDREERPDVDKIYMHVCQSLTGSGGWPLSIFMTPEGKPFFAGTYFPKSGRLGMPGFVDVLEKVSAMWQGDRARILKSSEAITAAIQPKSESGEATGVVSVETLKKGYSQLARRFDTNLGGFGSAPKFPTPHHLTFLLRWHKRTGDKLALEMVEKTLEAMRNGGIFDQIGYGFHRYSVDAKWLVPHFEKMLYDQALLAMAYTEAYQATGNDRFADTAREIFSYVLRDMTAPGGGYYSAEDADSEGKEGLFYVWTPREVIELLGKELGELFCRFYGITGEGNFEDRQRIPHIRMSHKAFASRHGIDLQKMLDLLEEGRAKLFRVRKERVHPLKDDKILTSWNGLMIAAFSKGYQVLGEQTYVDSALKATRFIMQNLRGENGRLLRRFREGDAAYLGYLDDYAFFVWGLIELYEATFEVSYLEEAIVLTNAMTNLFWDRQNGGLYFTGLGNEKLITRSKELYDGALPSGNSVAASNFMRLTRLTGNIEMEKRAEQLTRTFTGQIEANPVAYTQFLNALDFMVGPTQEIVISGGPFHDSTQAMIKAVRGRFLPNKVLLLRGSGSEGEKLTALSPFVQPMAPVDNKPTAYVCEKFSCKTPTTEVEKLEAMLD
ncbi:MAG: thioredoxin domain-containing protein [Deltaproteobacteria bacterium]|nr:thioredoxin domain-containing protein [Deltaproteobacteria bacterium]